MDRPWELARDWTPPRTRKFRLPKLSFGRRSGAVLGVAWLIPILMVCWQIGQMAGDAPFQQAPHHSTDWLVARVGTPQRVARHGQRYQVWLYYRGGYKVEVAVDSGNIVRAVHYFPLR